MRVLCIDDAELVRSAVKHEVLKLGYECVEAEDAFEAREILEKESFNLIILDINMPGKTGLELLAELKNDNVKHAPVVMLTTESSSSVKAQGKELGVKAWIVKPMNMGMVKQIIDKIAEK